MSAKSGIFQYIRWTRASDVTECRIADDIAINEFARSFIRELGRIHRIHSYPRAVSTINETLSDIDVSTGLESL